MATENSSKDNANAIVPAGEAAAKPAFKVKAVGLAARKQALAAKLAVTGQTLEINPADATHKIGIVFDDSASMSGSKIGDAHAGTEEFLRSCDPKNTAVAVYPMNRKDENDIFGSAYHTKVPLSSKLYTTAVAIKAYQAIGGTPLFRTLMDMLTGEVLTRGIIFSDGEPNYDDARLQDEAIALAVAKAVPIDTVFIGHKSDTRAVEIMQTIAEKTGGIFMIFEPGKANFRTAFKYLSPGYRAMLADKSFVADLQEGKVNE